MRQVFFGKFRVIALLAGAILAAAPAMGDSAAHGIAMYGDPALPPDFVSLPYANPDAPKGGRVTLGENGGFDSLNPFILKGVAPRYVALYMTETLMARSFDEPFTLYGLLAESVTTDSSRSYVEFTLRAEARFSDGSPVTPDDVLWSFETLGTKGHPKYANAWAAVSKAEITGPRSIRFTFSSPNRELPLLLGLRPVLKKAQWEGKDFTASTLEAPIGSGPYVVAGLEPGRYLSLRRNPDWWGKDLPVNRGRQNFDEIRVEYFSLDTAQFEAFKAGELSLYRETNPVKWLRNFDFPAVSRGDVVKDEIAHGRPSGIEGFAFNTRRPLFADWRVREALILAFDFEQANTVLNDGSLPRIASYFSNSPLGMLPDTPAEGRERALLEPFTGDLLPGALEGYSLPKGDGSGANRRNLRAATKLLAEAGWTVQDGTLRNAEGAPFTFEILLTNGQLDMIGAATIYIEALKRLGIKAHVTTVDNAQYVERTNAFNFDMTHFIRALSLSPGTEQRLYWGSAAAAVPGSRNWPGIASPAVDAMIDDMLTTDDPEEFTAATRALDRVLTTGRYVLPLWYSPVARVAHDRRITRPDPMPLYGDWPEVTPDVWWMAP